MHADVYPLGSACVTSGYSNHCAQFSTSGKVYHIYPSPDSTMGSVEPPPSDAIMYDPDLMFREYQVSANSGGMFRRFPFQKAFHGASCITQDGRSIIYHTCSRRHATSTLYPQVSVGVYSYISRIDERLQRRGPLQGGMSHYCCSLAGTRFSSRSMLRIQPLHLRIPRMSFEPRVMCEFSKLFDGGKLSRGQIGITLQVIPFQGRTVQRGAQLCLQGGPPSQSLGPRIYAD